MVQLKFSLILRLYTIVHAYGSIIRYLFTIINENPIMEDCSSQKILLCTENRTNELWFDPQ